MNIAAGSRERTLGARRAHLSLLHPQAWCAYRSCQNLCAVAILAGGPARTEHLPVAGWSEASCDARVLTVFLLVLITDESLSRVVHMHASPGIPARQTIYGGLVTATEPVMVWDPSWLPGLNFFANWPGFLFVPRLRVSFLPRVRSAATLREGLDAPRKPGQTLSGRVRKPAHDSVNFPWLPAIAHPFPGKLFKCFGCCCFVASCRPPCRRCSSMLPDISPMLPYF